MKKIIIVLIATVMFTSLSFAQTSSIDYFDKPIFKLIEKSKPDLYNELTADKIEIQKTKISQ